MLKKLLPLLSLFITISLCANNFKDGDKLEILAKEINAKDNIIIAKGDVLLYSPQYYITATKALYNKTNSTIELFDNVNIIKDGKMITFTNYAYLNLDKDKDIFTPILLLSNIHNIWVNSKTSNKQNDLITFEDATLSSCDCYDPAWSLSFSDGDYNTTAQWLNTYNTTLYVNQIPVLYTPYFAFPADKTRRTGLLRPTVGYTQGRGFNYAQPYFYAPSLNWDLEYIPQIKDSRGHGHHLKYRYKDSKVSSLKVEVGIFQERSEYVKEASLVNDEHYGFDLKYIRSNVITKNDNQDGLLVSLHSLNDIDYINTQVKNNSTLDKKLVESKLKYFYNTNNYYGDIDFKYYDDTSKITSADKDTTMHELPKVHFHKYSSQTFIKNLLYSTDMKISSKTRETGLKANSTNIFIPLTYSVKLLDDYINFMYSQQITLININYGNNVKNYENGQFIENKHIFTLSTDLLKPYKSYIHTINLKTSLTIPKVAKQDGDLYSVTNDNDDLNIFPVSKTKKNLTLALNQAFYNKDNQSKKFAHKLIQSIVYDNGTSKLSDLENTLILYYKYGQLSNKFIYNHQDSMIINASTTSTFKKDNFNSRLYYSYSKDMANISSNTKSYSYRDIPDAKSITLELGYGFYKYYHLKYKEEYDLVDSISKLKSYTFNINKKCWAFDVRLENSIVASATTDNSAIRQDIIYFEFTLKPIVKINQEYKNDRKK